MFNEMIEQLGQRAVESFMNRIRSRLLAVLVEKNHSQGELPIEGFTIEIPQSNGDRHFLYGFNLKEITEEEFENFKTKENDIVIAGGVDYGYDETRQIVETFSNRLKTEEDA